MKKTNQWEYNFQNDDRLACPIPSAKLYCTYLEINDNYSYEKPNLVNDHLDSPKWETPYQGSLGSV